MVTAEEATKTQVAAFFWVMYNVQPDWLYMGQNGFTPVFLNQAIRDKFMKLCQERGWAFGYRSDWRNAVTRVGEMSFPERREAAASVQHLLMPKWDSMEAKQDNGGSLKSKDDEKPERSITFED